MRWGLGTLIDVRMPRIDALRRRRRRPRPESFDYVLDATAEYFACENRRDLGSDHQCDRISRSMHPLHSFLAPRA